MSYSFGIAFPLRLRLYRTYFRIVFRVCKQIVNFAVVFSTKGILKKARKYGLFSGIILFAGVTFVPFYQKLNDINVLLFGVRRLLLFANPV